MKYYLVFCIVVAIFAVVSLILAILHISWAKKLSKHVTRRSLIVISMTILGLAVAGIIFNHWLEHRHPAPTVKRATSTQKYTIEMLATPTPQPTASTLPQYTLLGLQKNQGATRLEIVMPEKDNTKLIALNDYLYTTYKGTYKSFFIDYFDNKAVAQTYFAQENDPSVNQTVKNQLRHHYIALMVVSPLFGSILYRQTTTLVVLKKY